MGSAETTTTLLQSVAGTVAQDGGGLSGAWIVLIACVVVLVIVGVVTGLLLRTRKQR